MNYKKQLLMGIILIALMVSTPAYAQTTTDVLENANGEAVQVISSGLSDMMLKLGGMLLAIVAIYAYALYKSSPPAVQKLIIENGENTLKALKEHTETTINKFDDKIADVASVIFNAVMQMIEDEKDEAEGTPTVPTPPNTPVQ
jgi:hypothetical protein